MGEAKALKNLKKYTQEGNITITISKNPDMISSFNSSGMFTM
jgi:hypothetical protein